MAGTDTKYVITANGLADGRVIYLDALDQWTADLAGAEVFEGTAELDAGLNRSRVAEDACVVVGAYQVEVTVNGGATRPVRYREQLRARGPSSHPEFTRSETDCGGSEDRPSVASR